jgi:hypothetical protein
MNILSRLLTFTFVVSFVVWIGLAKGQMPNSPIWQQFSPGISTTLTLTAKQEGGSKRTKLTIFVKNTSSDVKSIVRVSDGSGVTFSVQDDKSNWRPLRSHSARAPISAHEEKIMPGATWSYSIVLSPQETALVEAHPIQCSFDLQDWSEKQTFSIQSCPEQLTETVESSPTK